MRRTDQSPISEQRLNGLIRVFVTLRDGAAWMVVVCDTVILAFEELNRIRDGIRRNRKPLDWEEFKNACKEHDWLMAQYMDQLSSSKFELGRLVLEAESSQVKGLADLFKHQLQDLLKKSYGVDFRVKISMQGEN